MERKDIVIVADYHRDRIEFRKLNMLTGEETRFNRATTAESISKVLEDAEKQVPPEGGVGIVWIMESTTGWARVKKIVGERTRFLLVNPLKMPKLPKEYRSKSDKRDTARMLHEYRLGTLPLSYQPDDQLRSRRRLVALREDLVARQTQLRNQIKAHLAQETWEDPDGLWSGVGMARLAKIVAGLEEEDRFVLGMKIAELKRIARELVKAEKPLLKICAKSDAAQRVDAIKGVGEVSAVSIVARIGPVERFQSAEALINYAGLSPGMRGSDKKIRSLEIGGGGTDKRLRHYVIEATMWARTIPRYTATYERAVARRGKRVGRIVVARLMLRSIYKMLRTGVAFDPGVSVVPSA